MIRIVVIQKPTEELHPNENKGSFLKLNFENLEYFIVANTSRFPNNLTSYETIVKYELKESSRNNLLKKKSSVGQKKITVNLKGF